MRGPTFVLATLAGILAAAAAQSSVIVVTVPAPQPTNEPTYRDDDDFKSQVLNGTNLYRYEHNATAVAWNDSLAAYATNWTSSCVYGHSVSPCEAVPASSVPRLTSL